jgi:7-carboxy-7-deazaguanine synthase
MNHIVITGGEPLLQQDKLVSLLKLLKSKRKKDDDSPLYNIEMETNGTILPIKEIIDHVDQWNISPKISNSNNKERGINLERFYKKSLSFYINLKNAFFKFVVDELDDVKEIEQLIQKYGLPQERIILMPQATTKEILLEKSIWIQEYAKRNDFIFSTRLQVLLWNNQREK